jgi:hypothetical protein
LEHLTESISLLGKKVDIVHIYANYPDYQWLEARDADVEGVACVDDAARAAVVYLRHYQLAHDINSLDRAKRLVQFILTMQTEDGEFYNFIFGDHSINTKGKTSFKSFGWWASRGVWCLGLGYRVFRESDLAFALSLKAALDRSHQRARALLKRYGLIDTVSGFRVPRWLPYESGSDVTAEMLLGLIEYYDAAPDSCLKNTIEKLADGIMLMQEGNAREYPYGLHRSWETLWHMWGNSQTQALARAGKILGNRAMVESAEREARGFYSRLLKDGFMKEFDLAMPDSKTHYEQIAYAVRPMAVGLVRLFEATGKQEYLTMAGLAGSWFLGNNVLRSPMYDPVTGRCLDGIRDSVTLNRNSGAESTIEALYTLLELEQYPTARKYLSFTRVSVTYENHCFCSVFRNAAGDELTLALDPVTGNLVLLENEASREFHRRYQ